MSLVGNKQREWLPRRQQRRNRDSQLPRVPNNNNSSSSRLIESKGCNQLQAARLPALPSRPPGSADKLTVAGIPPLVLASCCESLLEKKKKNYNDKESTRTTRPKQKKKTATTKITTTTTTKAKALNKQSSPLAAFSIGGGYHYTNRVRIMRALLVGTIAAAIALSVLVLAHRRTLETTRQATTACCRAISSEKVEVEAASMAKKVADESKQQELGGNNSDDSSSNSSSSGSSSSSSSSSSSNSNGINAVGVQAAAYYESARNARNRQVTVAPLFKLLTGTDESLMLYGDGDLDGNLDEEKDDESGGFQRVSRGYLNNFKLANSSANKSRCANARVLNIVSDPSIDIIPNAPTHNSELRRRSRQQHNTLSARKKSLLHHQLTALNDPSLFEEAITIDKIKGIDLTAASSSSSSSSSSPYSRYKMARNDLGMEQDNTNKFNQAADKETADLSSSSSSGRLVDNGQRQQNTHNDKYIKCNNNKFDQLIAQKMRMNSLSRPIVKSDGRFDNPFSTWRQISAMDLVKFVIMETDESNLPKNGDELDKELPILKPNFTVDQSKKEDFRLTWIGHATTLIQVDGLNILTDPIFSDRASPTQMFGPKRFREPACNVKSLPKIDIVLISHNHYDHLDTTSVMELNERFGNNLRWIVPLGLGEFMRSVSVNNYVELDWWQKDCFYVGNNNQVAKTTTSETTTTTTGVSSSSPKSNRSISPKRAGELTPPLQKNDSSHQTHTSGGGSCSDGSATIASRETPSKHLELDVYLTPSQHWTRRGVNDVCKTLWGSFTIVSSKGSTFFFGGDTGYCSVFKEISDVFGPITGAAIPIGAYHPRWFMRPSHVDPAEAVQIHRDLKCSKSISIHHSTFALANEYYKEPPRLLREIMADLKAKESVDEPFITLKHGESTDFIKV